MRESIQTNNGLTVRPSETGTGVYVNLPNGPEVFVGQTKMERIIREDREDL